MRTRSGKAVIFLILLVAIRTETKEGKIISQTNTQGVEKRRRENKEYEAVKFWLVFKRTSTRSSSSSGILSLGGSSDSVFVSSPSTAGLHSSQEPPMLPHQSHLALCKTSLEGFPLGTSTGYPRTRKCSGFELAPSIPKFMAQSVEGQTPLDKWDLNRVASHFLFPLLIQLH